MGWFASLCARTRRFGAHLRTQNGPTRGNVRAHHSAVRRDSADQASKKPDWPRRASGWAIKRGVQWTPRRRSERARYLRPRGNPDERLGRSGLEEAGL